MSEVMRENVLHFQGGLISFEPFIQVCIILTSSTHCRHSRIRHTMARLPAVTLHKAFLVFHLVLLPTGIKTTITLLQGSFVNQILKLKKLCTNRSNFTLGSPIDSIYLIFPYNLCCGFYERHSIISCNFCLSSCLNEFHALFRYYFQIIDLCLYNNA